VIQKCADQPDFLGIVFFTDVAGFTRNGVFNSQNKQVLQGFEGHRRALIRANILNDFSNCKLVMVFALTFPFTVFTLCFLSVFAAVYLKRFSAISFVVKFCHSVFKTFLRLFMFPETCRLR
jgi:hypothetical protein